MNREKKNLIMAALIINFVLAGVSIFSCIFDFITASDSIGLGSQQGLYNLISVILEVLRACVLLASGILLMFSIKDEGKYFKKRKSLYIIGVILTAIVSPLEISSIILYFSLAKKDEPFVQEFIEVDNGVIIENSPQDPQAKKNEEFKAKVEQLRKLRDEGVITEQEFKSLLMKLF